MKRLQEEIDATFPNKVHWHYGEDKHGKAGALQNN